MNHSSLTTLADNLQQLSYDLTRYYAVCDRFCVEELEVTASQGYILLALPETGNITMNELSGRMKLANSTMTRMADQLIQKKMITRESDPLDRRIVRVQLTKRGQDVKAHLKTALHDVFTQVLLDIPADKREAIVHSLEALNQSIVKTLKSCCDVEEAE
jgi:MarR family transcriptional regulator, organic hydroperoxide resistance regulator